MSDSDLSHDDLAPQEAAEQAPAADSAPKPKPVKRKSSMWDDPVVVAMAWIAGAVVILGLATIIGLVFFGSLGSKAPRTAVERRVYEIENLIASGSQKDPAVWASYVNALVQSGKYTQAEAALKKGASLSKEQERNADLVVAKARMQLARKDYKGAFATAEEAQKIIQKFYDAELKSDALPNMAKAFGISKNFGEAALIKAQVYEKNGDVANAEKQYTVFLKVSGQAADVYIMRGDARAKLGDTKGAKSDYTTALQYDPTNQAALDGLKQIGEGK
jgi:tetratricopeptide (TPR) repeat protein